VSFLRGHGCPAICEAGRAQKTGRVKFRLAGAEQAVREEQDKTDAKEMYMVGKGLCLTFSPGDGNIIFYNYKERYEYRQKNS